MGSEELNGVLYRVPQTSLETRKRKKRSKSAQVDPNRPKAHRSGYNFFFSETYQKLRAEYVGRRQLLTKEIGIMWSNLSEADRQVTQKNLNKSLP